MADSKKDDVERSDEQLKSRYDAEKEIPDPEQVERDRKDAEKIYGNQDRKAS